MLTKNQGEALIKLARRAIKSVFMKKPLKFEKEKKEFPAKQGVFVTLITWPSHELRGCIGFPSPMKPLAEAIVEAAKAAAFSDIRFRPLQEKELDKIVIEISILTEPKLIQAMPQELPRLIKVGKDGLIVQFSSFSGLLLPQVALEQGWNSLDFLRGACVKAGLPPETWLNPNCKVYKFQTQIFYEERPRGKVIEKKM